MKYDDVNYTLEKHLKNICDENYQYMDLFATWEIDKKVYKNMLQAIAYNFPHYSMHESSHSKSIISNIEMVLGGDRIKLLAPTETWMILESSYLHDFGMILQNEYIDQIWKSDKFQEFLVDSCKSLDKDLKEAVFYILNFRKLIDKDKIDKDWPVKIRRYVVEIISAYFRTDHPKRSMEYINTFNETWKMDLTHGGLIKSRLIKLIGKVAFLHGQPFEEVKKLEYKATGLKADYIHPRFIAEMIRLGDLLDIDNGRFNESLIKVFGDLPEISKIHFKKHGDITHVLISPTTIEISADCEDYDEIRETRNWFDWIQSEIRDLTVDWVDIVPPNFDGYPPKIKSDSLKILKKSKYVDERLVDLKLNIPRKRIFEILEGAGIYKNKYDFLRELIQNALDASKIQMWRDLKNGMYDLCIGKGVKLKNLTPFDINKQIYDNYKVVIDTSYTKDNKIRISVIDKGIGIDKDSLFKMSQVGESWNKRSEYKKELKDMPSWLKPTGGFGIGLQSCFMHSDEIDIETKSCDTGRKIKIESGKQSGYIISEEDPNISMSRGTKVTVKIPKDSRISYSIPSYVFDKLKNYDSFKDKNMVDVWIISEYLSNEILNSLFEVELIYNNEKELCSKSLKEEYGRIFASNKCCSENGYLFAFNDKDFNEIYLWDKKSSTFIMLKILDKDEYGRFMNQIYFRGVKVNKSNIGYLSSNGIVCDINGMDTNETLTLDRQSIRNGANRKIVDIFDNAIKFALEKYSDKILKDDKFIINNNINALTLRLMNDVYNINNRELNNILVENCNDEIECFLKEGNKYEYKKIKIKDILKYRLFSLINLGEYSYVNFNKVMDSVKKAINEISMEFDCKYILPSSRFTEFITQYNLFYDKKDIKYEFEDKTIKGKLEFYKIFSRQEGCRINEGKDARKEILLSMYNTKFKRMIIGIVGGYEKLAVIKLPVELEIELHYGRFSIFGNKFIISPIIKDDYNEIKNGIKKKLIEDKINDRDDFKKLVDYVFQNKADSNKASKEDIIKSYMELIGEYYDLIKEESKESESK